MKRGHFFPLNVWKNKTYLSFTVKVNEVDLQRASFLIEQNKRLLSYAEQEARELQNRKYCFDLNFPDTMSDMPEKKNNIKSEIRAN